MDPLHQYVLSFCFFSQPKSFYAPEEFEHVKVFNHQEINSYLNLTDTFHFNRGEPNFFSQHGPASFAFWARSFYLNKEEADLLNSDVEGLLEILFEKLKNYLIENEVTKEKISVLKQVFDCRCEALFSTLRQPGIRTGPFTLRQGPLQTLTEFGIDFEYWPLDENQIDQLKEFA
ncbi:hypothetical protein [Planococcus beigongshangi]|uniref:hypothetical protein n=1 Tax=Planococcus beigongshangi TaxID=2782536 RepID=UPI00193AF9DC|nr:hypothetical protein [Planococcus beigongshangi]